MSIIAVRGMPPRVKLPMLIRKLAHVVKCQFQAFNPPHKPNVRTYFLKLPQKLDPFKAINMINEAEFPYKLEAFMPVIDYDLKVPSKAKKVPQNLRKSLRIPPNLTSIELLQRTCKQIMTEMLSKFTQLYTLSKTTDHLLLHTLEQTLKYWLANVKPLICLTVTVTSIVLATVLGCQPKKDFPTAADTLILNQRLQSILTTTKADSCYNLSKFYRHNYIHSKDFELIRDVLNKIQKSQEISCEEINEKEFCLYNPEGDDVEDLSIICNTYSQRIIDKIMNHIKNFNKDIRPDNQQDLITAEVRQHIHNMAPLIPTIIKDIIRDKLITKTFTQPFAVLRIYGEPFLPNKERMNPFLKHFSYTNVQRSEDSYNLITVKIPSTNYLKLLKCDGNIVSGARLVIRPLMGKEHSSQLKEISSMTPQININIDVQEFCT